MLQAIPDSKNSKQKIILPDHRNKKKQNSDVYSFFPKSTKQKKLPHKFRTVEKDEYVQNAYSGDLKKADKVKVFRERLSSPAVPLPSHSRFTSHSNKLKEFDNTLAQDLKKISNGINFEVEPFTNNK